MAEYNHTQKSPLCLFIYGAGLALLAGAWMTREDMPFALLLAVIGSMTFLTGMAFHHLTVADEGNRLAIRFGPVPAFCRTVQYADILKVEVGRTLILDGWGIHYSIRGGWVWNLWGRDCVVVRFKNSGTLRIGANDAENLAGFLENKTAHEMTKSGMTPATTVRNRFPTRLCEKLASTQAGQNLFLSPFSIQVALAMCAVGAKGETRKVMADLIGAPENVHEQNRQYAEVLKSIHGDGERPFQWATANALWGQQGYRFERGFQEAIADFYDGALHEVNFLALPDEAVETINNWVSDKTGGKIKNLVQRDLIDQNTRLILTNAIYFKGKWQEEFQKSSTKDEDWHGPSGIRKVPMMHQKRDYLYCEGDGFQAIDVPYKGGQLSMLVVLPTKQNGLASLERRWAGGNTCRQVTDRLDHKETVMVSLPRFKMEMAFMLKHVLCALGADLAFSNKADFSGIGEEALKISEVVHKAFVEVNEEGTEAAAATTVGMPTCAAVMPTQSKVFKADHPFLFFIRDRNTNTVLFSGRVMDPK